MATLPPTVDDLAVWTGQSITDASRAVAVLSAAAALARGYAGQAWADNAVPEEVHAVVLQVAARVWMNPQGVVAETVDDYSRRFADEAVGGLLLTASERTILGRYRTSSSGLWVQPTTSGPLEATLDELFLRDLAHGDASGTYTPPAP